MIKGGYTTKPPQTNSDLLDTPVIALKTVEDLMRSTEELSVSYNQTSCVYRRQNKSELNKH